MCTDKFYPEGQQLLTFSCSNPSRFPRKFSCRQLRRLQALWPRSCKRLLHAPLLHAPCTAALLLHCFIAPCSTAACRVGAAGRAGIPWALQPGAGAALAFCSANVPCAASLLAGSSGSGVAGGAAGVRAAKASASGFRLPVPGAGREMACPVQPAHSTVLTALQ